MSKKDVVSPQMFTISEVAQMLSLSRSTIWELISRRELRSHKIGGARRIAHSDIEEFITRHVA